MNTTNKYQKCTNSITIPLPKYININTYIYIFTQLPILHINTTYILVERIIHNIQFTFYLRNETHLFIT